MSTSNTMIPLELHACLGLNACKGHDRFGANNCAGMGACATAQTHSCHTLNNCRGQGGCGLYGNAEEQNRPGENPCAWQGSCAVPINAERISTDGPNQGKSVWLRARQIFEERMKRAKRTFGPAPQHLSTGVGGVYDTTIYNTAEGPPTAWLDATMPGGYTACGASGLSGGGSCI
jgi:hypothetical protein